MAITVTTITTAEAFRARLHELLDASTPGVSVRVQVLADAIGADKTRVFAWMRGEGLPRTPALAGMARFYNVSSDWLLGLTDLKESK